MTILLLKTTFDALSRVLIFSIWLYVYNGGKFSAIATLTGYYVLLVTLMIFNLILNESKNFKSFAFSASIR